MAEKRYESSELAIKLVKVGDRYRRELGDLEQLAESIGRVGLLHPLVVRADGTVIAGARRLEAVRRLGWERVPVRVARSLDAALELLIAQRDENLCRKCLLPSEAVALADALRPLEAAEARRRQAATRARPGRKVGAGQGGADSAPPYERGKSRERVAKAVGLSHDSLSKAKAVADAAHAEPQKYGDLAERMDTEGKIDPVHRELRARQDPSGLEREGLAAINRGVALIVRGVSSLKVGKKRFGLSAETVAAICGVQKDLSRLIKGRLPAKQRPKKGAVKGGEFGPDHPAYQIAVALLEAIRSHTPDLREPNLQRWARDADRMLRLDSRCVDDVLEIVGWVHRGEGPGPEFWRGNILSTRKLRERFDQLVIKRRQEAKKGRRRSRTNPIPPKGKYNGVARRV